MTPMMVFREIILPQTWRVTLPPIGNYAVQLVKDTSLVAAIAAPEVMFTARNLVVTTFETSIIYSFAAGVYLLLCLLLSRLEGASNSGWRFPDDPVPPDPSIICRSGGRASCPPWETRRFYGCELLMALALAIVFEFLRSLHIPLPFG